MSNAQEIVDAIGEMTNPYGAPPAERYVNKAFSNGYQHGIEDAYRVAVDTIEDESEPEIHAIGGRIAIPHPSLSLEITSDGISPDLYAILTGSAMPAAEVTEEPPVGSQVTDKDDEVWGRFEEGWQVWDALGHMEWSGVSDPWSVVRGFAPLRPTTDEDRKRVGLPVEPACGCGAADGYHSPDCPRAPFPPEPAPADVDPDEALGALIWDRIWGTTWSIASEDNRAAYRNLASAVREHIEAEDEDAIQVAHLVEQLRALLNPPAEGEADHE